MELPVKIIIPDELLVAGPKGEPGRDGATPSLAIGTVETLAPGKPAFVTMSGVAPDYVLNFGIPAVATTPAPNPTTVNDFHVGDAVQVVGARAVKIRETPAGAELGTQPVGARGAVADGPVFMNMGGIDYAWWKIVYPTGAGSPGPSGWQVESWGDEVQLAPAPQPGPEPEPEPTMPWKVVWSKDNKPFASAFASPRVAYDGAKDALRFHSTAGEPNPIAQYSWYPNGTGTSLKATQARVSCEMFMQPGFEVKPAQSGKTALGLWIGVKHQPKAGAHPDDQVMATIRAYRPTTAAGQVEPRASIYSYHLNRPQNSAGDPTKWYGVGPRVKTPGGGDLVVPTGKWLRLVLEVKLNTVTDGKGNPDGWATYDIHDGADRLGRAHLAGAIWRDDPAWLIAGPSFNDMWGGGTGQTPPKTQDLWHRNYKIEVPQ